MPEVFAKLVLLGAAEVGKSCIALRFTRDVFDSTSATLGAAYFSQTVEVQGAPFRFEIWDTAGQERFKSIAPMYYRGAALAVVVYDVTSQKSFEKAQEWVVELQTKQDTIIALCGNKCDFDRYLWSVETAYAEQFAKEHKLLFYYCSALNGTHIYDIFMGLAEEFLKKDKTLHEPEEKINTAEKPKGKKGCC